MPVYALYNFDDTDGIAMDSALGNGNQFGYYLNGATAAAGQVVLDGENDLVKITPDAAVQMDRGTLDISFSLNDSPLTAGQTVLSRDAADLTDGAFRVEIAADGSVVITHESAGAATTYQTVPGFANPGDQISLSYSWDQGGAGGALILNNTTTGASFAEDVPNTLTMDQGSLNQPWVIGAGQASGTAQFDQNFGGAVKMFQLSDSVDNDGPLRDGIIFGTAGADLIDVDYTGDFDGDRIDGHDAVLPGALPDDDRIYAGEGNDTLLSGNGADLAYGGPGDDVIDTDTQGAAPLPDRGYPGLYAADADPMDDRDTVFGGVGNDTIRTGDDADEVHGGTGDDSIDGGFDDDTIFGDDGNDTILGAEGSDEIYGGEGDDLIYGGYAPGTPDAVNLRDDQGDLRADNGRDFIVGGNGDDTIFGMDDADTLYGGEGNDSLDGGIDNDEVYGGAGNDTLAGGQGNDTIDGDFGNDVILGGAGADMLYGGDDADIFVVGSAADGAGDTINGGLGGNDYDTLDLRGTAPFRLTGVVTDIDGNGIDGTVEFLDSDGNVTGALSFTNIEEIIPCFTPGTLIATPRGEVPVENLKAGDRVITRDNGIQEIRWLGHKALNWYDLAANPHLKPVLIRQGSLGNGLPERDMMVSPNHRMLVANDRTSLYFDEHEVLVAAKHLVAANGIGAVDAAGATYIHFMCDRHEVVLSNGAWTESFQPGDYTLKGMGNAQRTEIYDLFPELKTTAGRDSYQAARRVLKRHEAMLLVK